MNRRAFLVASGVISGVGWSQVRPSIATLNNDTASMRTVVVVDKNVYLLGEELRISLTVTNPTNRQLNVYQPLITTSGMATLVPLDDSGDMIPGRSTVSEFALSDADYLRWPVETFAPGQTRNLSFSSSDDNLDLNGIVLPSLPGRYGVYYSYQGSLARLRYVRPVLEQIVETRFSADLFVPGDDLGSPAENVAVFRYCFALRYDNVSYICAQRGKSQTFRRPGEPTYAGPVTSLLAHALQPYKILGTSAASITSLAATMDNAENLTILYATSPGGPQTRIDVDTNLNLR